LIRERGVGAQGGDKAFHGGMVLKTKKKKKSTVNPGRTHARAGPTGC